jgi:hypothetical protein
MESSFYGPRAQEGLGLPRGGSACHGIPSLGHCGFLRPSLGLRPLDALFGYVYLLINRIQEKKSWINAG